MNLRFRVLDAIDSTSEELKRLPATGTGEGFWLSAARQTAGRGRHGRSWRSEPSNLYASTIVIPDRADPPPQTLAFVAALAVHSLVAAQLGHAPELSIKWPNDVLWRGAKIAGILLERKDDRVIVGIGINLRHAPDVPGRATASLADLGMIREPVEALHDLAQLFASWLSVWRSDLAAVLDAWRAAAHPPGTPLRVGLQDGESIAGTYDGLSDQGALRLRLADGASRVIHAGDVFLV